MFKAVATDAAPTNFVGVTPRREAPPRRPRSAGAMPRGRTRVSANIRANDGYETLRPSAGMLFSSRRTAALPSPPGGWQPDLARLSDIQHVDMRGLSVPAIIDIYREAFPPDERPPWKDFVRRCAQTEGRIDTFTMQCDGKPLAFLMTARLRTPGFTLVPFLAISSRAQGLGIGSRIITRYLQQCQARGEPETLIVEVEDPQCTFAGYTSTREVRERRIRFYERLGAQSLQLDYATKHGTGPELPFRLMVLPWQPAHPINGDTCCSLLKDMYELYYENDLSDEPMRRVLASIGERVETYASLGGAAQSVASAVLPEHATKKPA